VEKIRVHLTREVDDSFDIVIGTNILDNVADGLLKLNLGRVCVITDATVKRLYGEKFHGVMKSRGINAVMVSIPPGKNDRDMKAQIEDIMLAHGLGKESVILALGGGTIADLAGFVSSTYYGGIPYLLLPTTLYCMVDHPIGGRVGVDTEKSRKVIGSYYRPKRVLIDLAFLDSLPPDAYIPGIIEMLRVAIVADDRFFILLEDYHSKLASDKELLAKCLKKALELKLKLLETDIKQLRFGTRLGHAFSRLGDRDWLALGVLTETRLAEAAGILNPPQARKVYALLEKLGAPQKHSYGVDQVLEHLPSRQFVFPRKLGKVEQNIDIQEDLIKKVLEGMR